MNGIKLVHYCFCIHAYTLSVFKSAFAIHGRNHFDFWTIVQLAYRSECPIIGHMKVNEVKCFTTHIMSNSKHTKFNDETSCYFSVRKINKWKIMP